jgi:uncharacterized protein with PQ loop repeat
MTLAALIAFLAAALSIGVKVIGMPAQIRHNYLRKSTEGLSNWFLVLTLLSYAVWVLHGLQVHDMSLVVGQGLGVAVTCIILWQAVVYSKNRRRARRSRHSEGRTIESWPRP